MGLVSISWNIFVFLPGWALLSLLWPQIKQQWYAEFCHNYQAMQNPITKLAISLGISLAIYPILFAWTDFFGLHLGSWYAWLPPIVGCVFLGLANVHN